MRVLIADDDKFCRVYLEGLLTKWGYEVITVEDGVGACEVLESNDPPSLAIIDWYMPGMDGPDVIRSVRAQVDSTRTYMVLLTDQVGETALVEAFDAGADDYVRKPFKQAELNSRLKVGARLMGLHSTLRSRVAELEEALVGRKRMEEALRKNEERFRLFFSTVPQPVWGFDGNTLQILEANDAAVTLYGYSREEFLKLKVSDLWAYGTWTDGPGTHGTGAHGASEQFHFEKGEEVPELRAWRGRHRTKDGREIEVEIFWRALNWEGRPAGLASAQDITEKKQLELELVHAQKLEAVGTLAAGIAHEINSPMQFVGDNTRFLHGAFDALSQVLLKYREACANADPGLPADVLEDLRQMEVASDIDYLVEETPTALVQTIDGIEQVTRIVRAMKDFAHPDRGNRVAADINRGLESVLAVGRNELKRVAEVETRFGEIPPVVCQIGEINQVFLNLLVNAAHAIADAPAHRKPGRIEIETCQDGEDVVISVSDTGVGVSEAIRNRIFDPFFTTKEVGRGSGQGLAISRAIVVDKHGGSLTFDSELGKGTTFRVRLPVAGKAENANTHSSQFTATP